MNVIPSSSMDTSTLLLIHQLVVDFIEKHENKNSFINGQLERLGEQLGTRVMMRVSDKYSSRITRDTSNILQLFAGEYWNFVFGKRG